jgi:hypothetical protein
MMLVCDLGSVYTVRDQLKLYTPVSGRGEESHALPVPRQNLTFVDRPPCASPVGKGEERALARAVTPPDKEARPGLRCV